ncbi:magnesium transporter CorA family protein [Deinococcus detaillensis]|uniref:Magnesium transporter CorA family protein n=1 Tax=Deinococcus detaillensis TaxID=2592048 RepID=A0A553UPC7_9DEIO|nr:magnesium transporter CorA family protein [Deinococcus detaillensis]TSA82058.1 magnesium transporter CorA family protein [Deinococcus detaillensis]
MADPTTQPLTQQPTSTAVHTYILGSAGAAAILWQAALVSPPPEHGFLWFDVTDPAPQDLERLQHQYHLHPLAIEDALHAHQRAKVESYQGFEFVVAHGVFKSPNGTLKTHELNLFIGERFLISVRHGSGLPLQDILNRWERVPETWRPDSSSLLYVLLDALVDEYAPFAEELEAELSKIRQRLIDPAHSNEQELKKIFEISELVHTAHAVIFPLKDVLGTLLRVGPPVVSPKEVPYFRDIRDHAQHTVERLELAGNMADRAFDIYHALENRRQGASSRQLTMVATIFLPLTLVTGFFGQNFGFLVNHVIASTPAFWILCVGFETLVAAVTIVFVQRIGSGSKAANVNRRLTKRASIESHRSED